MRVVKHHLSKRGNTYYFIKRVPKDVRRLHSSCWIKQSLKTADLPTARRLRDELLKQHEAKWSAYRALPEGKHISRQQLNEALKLRGYVLNGEDREGWLEAISERTAEVYDEDVPCELNGRATSEAAAEFYAIASGNKLPFRIALDQFLNTANLKPSTRGLYRGVLFQLADEFAFVEDMTRDAVRKFLQKYQLTRTRKTINNLITAGRSLLAFHGLNPDVFRGHRIDPGKELQEKGVWQDNEVLRLANANAPQWLRDCITVAMYSGLRRQEIGGLVYDEAKDQLVVTASRAKTKNSVRRVPCHPNAREAAKRIASKPIRLNAITVGFRELADRLGISRAIEEDGVAFKRDFHALRHTFASKLASLGADDWRIARIIGHSRKTITHHYAGKFDPEVDRELIERVRYHTSER